MKKFLQTRGLSFVLGLAIALSPATAFAETNGGSANGYKIAPVRTDLTIERGKSETTKIFVQNVSSVVENLQVVVNDFQARNDESGAPALLLNGKSTPQHGLKQFITISNPTFTLQPNEQKGIEVQISIPANASAGGYFGAIRVAPAGANGDKNVNLSASVASLVLVKVPGKITEQLSIVSLQALSGNNSHVLFTNGKGLNAAVRFHNTGDVQEEPFGKLQLKKGSKLLGSYEINSGDPRGNVLPDSVRKFTVPLTNLGSFGKYTLEGNFGYGTTGQLLSAKTTFYIVPVGMIVLAALVVLILLFLIIVLPKMVRSHDRNVLRRAGRR